MSMFKYNIEVTKEFKRSFTNVLTGLQDLNEDLTDQDEEVFSAVTACLTGLTEDEGLPLCQVIDYLEALDKLIVEKPEPVPSSYYKAPGIDYPRD